MASAWNPLNWPLWGDMVTGINNGLGLPRMVPKVSMTPEEQKKLKKDSQLSKNIVDGVETMKNVFAVDNSVISLVALFLGGMVVISLLKSLIKD